MNFIQVYKESDVSSDKIAQIVEKLSSGKYFFELINQNDLSVTSFQIIKN